MNTTLEARLDKTKISVSNSFDDTETREYWLARTPQERLAYMEKLRRINYGDKAGKGLQRILEVVKCEWR